MRMWYWTPASMEVKLKRQNQQMKVQVLNTTSLTKKKEQKRYSSGSLTYMNHFAYNNKSFLEFINILDPKYVVPCRSTGAELIKEEFDIKAEKVRTFLKNYEGKVNITSDGWSSNATDPYVVVTSSLITKEFKLGSFILDFFNFPHPHDAYNIKESIKEVNYLVLIVV